MAQTYYVYRSKQNKLIKKRVLDASEFNGVCVVEDDEYYVISINNVTRSKTGKIKNSDREIGMACFAYIEDLMKHRAVQADYRHTPIQWDASHNDCFAIRKPTVRPTDDDLDVCAEAFTSWFSARIENAPAAPDPADPPTTPDDPDDPDAPSDPNAPTNPPAPAQPEKTIKEKRAEALDLLGTSDFNAEALLDTYELGYDPDDNEEEDDEDE